MILLDLYFPRQPDAFRLIGGRGFAGPDEEFIRIAGLDCLEIAIELVEVIEVAEVIANADGGIDALYLAGPKRTTEVGLLDLGDFAFGLLHVVRVKIDHGLSVE